MGKNCLQGSLNASLLADMWGVLQELARADTTSSWADLADWHLVPLRSGHLMRIQHSSAVFVVPPQAEHLLSSAASGGPSSHALGLSDSGSISLSNTEAASLDALVRNRAEPEGNLLPLKSVAFRRVGDQIEQPIDNTFRAKTSGAFLFSK